MRALLMLAVLAGCASAASVGTAPKTWRNPKDGMVFVWVPAGKLVIGCPESEKCAESIPAREFSFDGFWAGRTEVTVAQFAAFVKATGYRTEPEVKGDPLTWRNPGFAQGKDHPVVGVTFRDAEEYAKWSGTAIPNYEEWEYAARAGSPHRYFWGPDFDREYAWFRVNSGGVTHPVGTKPANPFGLFDVSGNVWEWSRWTGWGPHKCKGISVPRGGSWATCWTTQLSEMVPFVGGRCFTTGGHNDDHGFRLIRRVAR